MGVNYKTQVLRASAATSGASEQDAAVTLPETVNEVWVATNKTAEANIDNLLTIRLQTRVNGVWFDLSYDERQRDAGTSAATDAAKSLTRTPNISDALTFSTFKITAHYKHLPSRTIRTVSVSSGTGVANTFSADVSYRLGARGA